MAFSVGYLQAPHSELQLTAGQLWSAQLEKPMFTAI